MRTSKEQRQQALLQRLEENPFVTDAELARVFGVSKQTIRLDRLSLSIPEVRERVKTVAKQAGGAPRLLFGDLIKLDPGASCTSRLMVTDDMVIGKVNMVHGYYLFAQAHALAMAVVEAPLALTGSARVRYHRPVYLGEEVIARGTVKVVRGLTHLVSVHSRVEGEIVFKGQFVILGAKEAEACEDSR